MSRLPQMSPIGGHHMPSSLYPAQKLIDLASNVLLRPLPSLLTLDAAHHQEGRVVRSTGHGQDFVLRGLVISFTISPDSAFTPRQPWTFLYQRRPLHIFHLMLPFFLLQNVHLSRPVARPKGDLGYFIIFWSFLAFYPFQYFFLLSQHVSSSETSIGLLM